MPSPNLHQIIKGPVVTEKSIQQQSIGKYSFWVAASASKSQVAAAFKSAFGVTPISVRTLSRLGKIKSDPRNRRPITKPNRKRAIITIPRDSKLELLSPPSK